MKVGDTLTVTGWRARDGGNWGHSREITLPSGEKMMFGPPAGTGDGGGSSGRRRPMRRALLAALVAGVWSAHATAQAPRAPEPSAVPRTAEGKPDLTGVWQGGSTQPGPWEEANAGLGVGGSGRDPNAPVVGSSNDRPAGREGAPYQDWAAQKVLEAFNRRGIDDPTGHCLPAGIPRSVMLGLFPQQFVQTPTQLVILYEYMSTFRVIPFAANHPDDLIPSYMGNSVARWDGDTLVVDIIGFNDKTWLAGTGTFHSDALHIVERYTRVEQGPHRLRSHDGRSERADEAVELDVEPDAPRGHAAAGVRVRREQHRSRALRAAAAQRRRLHEGLSATRRCSPRNGNTRNSQILAPRSL